jgi:indoleamine 2,3-dioxygenase
MLQRAHYVLAWLLHFYAHSIPKKDGVSLPTVIPRSLTIPLVDVSQKLGIAPVLCYADTVLWNWEFVDSSKPMTINNIRPLNSFSGTDDECGFYTSCQATELAGVELLQVIENYNSLPNLDDAASICKVHRDLNRLRGIIANMSNAIQSVREQCEPYVFYWYIRPWFNGSDAKGPNGPGWIYEGIDGSDKLDTSGPSAGQSTVVHALDVFLDVDHKLQKRRKALPTENTQKADHGFMERMRRYMPGRHREYLESLDVTPMTVRDLALQTPSLREPFDACVEELQKLRDVHMRIVSYYVLSMSRTTAPSKDAVDPATSRAEADELRAARKGPVRGTGGTELSLLLKSCRDSTKRTYINRR